jgi:hypothetical protein
MKKLIMIAALPLLFAATPTFGQEAAVEAAAATAEAAVADAAAPAGAAVEAVADMAKPAAAAGSGTGKLVFFRKGGLMGMAISCAVFENGVKVSSLSPGRYFEIDATEGVHQYSVRSEATDTLRIEVEAGETYYNECSIGMGIMAGRPNLSPVDEARWNEKKGKLKLMKKEEPKADKK